MTAAGMKVNDISAVCPFTKKPFVCFDENNPKIHGFQSRNVRFVQQMIIGKETRGSFKHFEGMIKFFDDCQ
jgi:hypothetical protein